LNHLYPTLRSETDDIEVVGTVVSHLRQLEK